MEEKIKEFDKWLEQFKLIRPRLKMEKTIITLKEKKIPIKRKTLNFILQNRIKYLNLNPFQKTIILTKFNNIIFQINEEDD
jgi:hypothetical protein